MRGRGYFAFIICAARVQDNGKTQLAVSIPIEEPLQSLLAEAREDVVNCVLLLSGMHSREEAENIETSSTWIPEVAHIPQKDLHITVCIPSLWREPDADPKAHGDYNSQVTEALLLEIRFAVTCCNLPGCTGFV